MARPKKSNGGTGSTVSVHQHSAASRLNIPEATHPKAEVPKALKPTYRYSPHLTPTLRFDTTAAWEYVEVLVEKALAGVKLSPDEAKVLRAAAKQGAQPWLEWASKQEQEGRGAFAVDDVVLHVHERVSAKAIISAVQREEEESHDLFARPKLNRDHALQFYRHNVEWANRLILGDSLQVMGSLANRENLAGKVQMIYIDPPYGIKFSSNWQNEVGKRAVGDKDEDVSREPETIKAYRDTWTLGVHSYLSYLKQRLVAIRELLSDTGSLFLQIGEENLHRVRLLLDEVMEPQNFVAVITVRKTATPSLNIDDGAFYILWYAKVAKSMKYIPLYAAKPCDEWARDTPGGSWGMEHEGQRRSLTPEEKDDTNLLPKGSDVYCLSKLTSAGSPAKPEPFDAFGQRFDLKPNEHWKTGPDGLKRLYKANRLEMRGRLWYTKFYSDGQFKRLHNVWTDTAGKSGESLYVVQTQTNVVERCMLMTTEPGDLIVDPTCGSGTTAIVAEQWGRRWITIDSSRVALSITRQRILTATFESYKTKDPSAGVDPAAPQNPGYGFYYKTVPHVTLKSIAQNRYLDPIFTKYEPILTGKLETLNRTLSAAASCVPELIAKFKMKVEEEGVRAITAGDLRRWLLPGTNAALLTFGTAAQRSKWKDAIPTGPGWQEWEVPFDSDPSWPRELQNALAEYRKLWRAKMDEVNASIAASSEQEDLVDEPEVVRGVTRVSGPFSVEGVRPEELALGEDGKVFDPTADEFDEVGSANAEGYFDLMIHLMMRDGVTFLGNRRAEFASLEKESGRSFNARGTWKGREIDGPSVAVVFGPQYGPVNAPMTVEAVEAARDLKEITDLVIAGFSFDAAAQQKAKELDSPAMRVHLAHIRPDVSPGMQGLLKETPNSQLFTVFGQPDIAVRPAGDGEYKVEMNGVCVYNPLTGEISDSSNAKVAAWFLDADYDGRCFCFSQAFFPDKAAWDKIAKALGSSLIEGAFQAFTTSWPFKPGKHNRIAVKVIDPRGNEVMAIKTLST